MPFYSFDFLERQSEYTYDDTYVFVEKNTCRLTRRDSSGNWSSDGLFYQSTVQFPEWTGTAIRQLTSVAWIATTPEDSTIDFQVSTDGGTVWQYYDGAAWQTAGASDWMSVDNFATGTPTLSTTRLIVKARLTPSTGGVRTPLLELFNVYYEGVWNYFEDLKRSIKRKIDSDLNIDISWAEKVTSSTSTITLTTPWEVNSVETAYDLTNDPYRSTNLYQSYAGGVVTLSSAVSNATIEVNFKGKCPVFLSADENFVITELPAIVLELPVAIEDDWRSKNLFEYEPISQDDIYRRREKRIPMQSSIMLRCLSDTEVDSLAMIDGLSDLFQAEGPLIRSLANGEDFFVLTFTPLRANDVISTGLYDKAIQMQVLGNQELTGYTEVPGTVDINIVISGATALTEEEHPVTNPSLPKSDICSELPPEEELIS